MKKAKAQKVAWRSEITIPLTRAEADGLQDLLDTGLWGTSIEEVAVRVLDEHLRICIGE